jgi:hypothetical protein
MRENICDCGAEETEAHDGSSQNISDLGIRSFNELVEHGIKGDLKGRQLVPFNEWGYGRDRRHSMAVMRAAERERGLFARTRLVSMGLCRRRTLGPIV